MKKNFLIFLALVMPMVSFGQQEKKVFWSEGDYKILELDPEDAVPSADLFLSLVHPDDRDDAEKSMQHSIEQHVD